MGDRKKISALLTLATGLSFALFGFVAINYNDYHRQLEHKEESISWACGTVAYDNLYLLSPAATRGEEIFRGYCRSCHRMKEQLVGPALSGVFERRDSVWIRKMIINAATLRKKGDKEAIKLYNQYGQSEHTSFPDMNKENLDALLTYLKEEY